LNDAPLTSDPGSFRDHSNRVYAGSGDVYRGLDTAAASELRSVMQKPFFARAVAHGTIVATEWLDQPPAPVDEHWDAWLRHDRIPVVSYPYEWTFSMLRDAALIQLSLLTDMLGDDVVSKDASPYNVQFVGSSPMFIDVGSFEGYRSGDPWFGYRQFCQQYLFPLFLVAYKDIPFQPWLRGSLEGLTPVEARQVLKGAKRGWRGLPTHVWIHARLEERMARRSTEVKEAARRAGFSKRLIELNVAKLTSLVEGLEWRRADSEWSTYSERSHYTDRDLAAKEDFVRRAAEDFHPNVAWDVGANDGRFSRIVAEHAEYVVALDADHLVVDLLYRNLRAEQNTKILPLMFNLADPSPALGWRGRERRPLEERNRPDLALYLAVIHHLSITHHVPVRDILDSMAATAPRLVVEFPHRDDPMVRLLLRDKRPGVHQDYDLDVFDALVKERFDVVARHELPSGTRTMYDLRRRA
jgi:hypothetical protein